MNRNMALDSIRRLSGRHMTGLSGIRPAFAIVRCGKITFSGFTIMKDLMRAVSIREPGGPGVLEETRVPRPDLRDHDVLVRVRAAGVNRPDVLQRQGSYPVPADASPLPGLEIAGEIAALGENATRWKTGERVMALAHGGGYAEYCRVDQDHCLPLPDRLSMVEAAAVPETFFTVWYNVFMRAGIADGETLLVHGGSSGIGTTAIQLGKAFGARVFVTAGSDEKCRFCEHLGADGAINYRTQDWEARVSALSGAGGIDVVLDMVAGPYMQKNMNVLARDGRYVVIAFLGGSTAELDMRQVLGKRLTITGSTLRPQTTAEKAAIAEALRDHVMPLLESGRIRPIIHAKFPLAEACRAHELMESSAHMGKIVLEI
jgi:putative PIG3 family NAD(P)H quinone oxidoreductase